MSVVVGKRSKCDFRVIADAKELVGYSMKKLRNERLFPKRQRWILSQRIMDTALNINSCIRQANSAKLDANDPESCAYRRRKQIEAQGYIADMYDLLDIAFFNLDELRNDDCYDYWTGLVTKVEKGFQAWVESDLKTLDKQRGNV